MPTVRSRVIDTISSRGVDELLRPADFENLGEPSTIYNIFSDLVGSGSIRRIARGVYTRSTRKVEAGEVAQLKATARNRRISQKQNHQRAENDLPQYVFSTDGRSTSFQLLEYGVTVGVVVLQERNRNSHRRRSTSKQRPKASVALEATAQPNEGYLLSNARGAIAPPAVAPERVRKNRSSNQSTNNNEQEASKSTAGKNANAQVTQLLSALKECLSRQESILLQLRQIMQRYAPRDNTTGWSVGEGDLLSRFALYTTHCGEH